MGIMEPLERLERAGLKVRMDGEQLAVSPTSKLTADLIAFIKANRAAIIEAVRVADDWGEMDAAIVRQVNGGAWLDPKDRPRVTAGQCGNRYIPLARMSAGPGTCREASGGNDVGPMAGSNAGES